MTSPIELITRYAAEYYNKAPSSVSSSVSSSALQSYYNKSIAYALGTTILITVLYKSVCKRSTTPLQRPYNFLYTISLPFQYLYYKLLLKHNPSVTENEIVFEDKYFKEYDEWVTSQVATTTNKITTTAEEEHKKECLENMYYSTVSEKINEFYGDVIMCYDHATLSFAYYARTGNIPYKYLETISRKYMIDTNAPREIHVDIRDEYKKAKERTQNTVIAAEHNKQSKSNENAEQYLLSQTKDTGDPPNDVFVKLKSYNTVSNLNLHTTTNDTKEKTHKFVGEHTDDTNESTNNGNTTDKIIRDKANRYSYRGKIDDFTEHHKKFLAERRNRNVIDKVDNQTIESETPLGYADFKKQIKNRSAL
jgi:hypothetical protein